MHIESISDKLISMLENRDYKLYKFSLVCSENALVSRIRKDIENGMRDDIVLERSLMRLNNYNEMDTIKIDVSDITSEQAARNIHNIIYPA